MANLLCRIDTGCAPYGSQRIRDEEASFVSSFVSQTARRFRNSVLIHLWKSSIAYKKRWMPSRLTIVRLGKKKERYKKIGRNRRWLASFWWPLLLKGSNRIIEMKLALFSTAAFATLCRWSCYIGLWYCDFLGLFAYRKCDVSSMSIFCWTWRPHGSSMNTLKCRSNFCVHRNTMRWGFRLIKSNDEKEDIIIGLVSFYYITSTNIQLSRGQRQRLAENFAGHSSTKKGISSSRSKRTMTYYRRSCSTYYKRKHLLSLIAMQSTMTPRQDKTTTRQRHWQQQQQQQSDCVCHNHRPTDDRTKEDDDDDDCFQKIK